MTVVRRADQTSCTSALNSHLLLLLLLALCHVTWKPRLAGGNASWWPSLDGRPVSLSTSTISFQNRQICVHVTDLPRYWNTSSYSGAHAGVGANGSGASQGGGSGASGTGSGTGSNSGGGVDANGIGARQGMSGGPTTDSSSSDEYDSAEAALMSSLTKSSLLTAAAGPPGTRIGLCSRATHWREQPAQTGCPQGTKTHMSLAGCKQIMHSPDSMVRL